MQKKSDRKTHGIRLAPTVLDALKRHSKKTGVSQGRIVEDALRVKLEMAP